MRSSRDDMVFRPEPERQPSGMAQKRARVERQMARAEGRHSKLGRLARYTAAGQATRRGRRAIMGRPRMTPHHARSPGMGNRIARYARKLSPVGLGITAGLIGIGVGLRVLSGKPIESLGHELNRAFLGDMDEQQRAWSSVRAKLYNNPTLLEVIGRTTKDKASENPEIRDRARRWYEAEKIRQDGATKIRETFPVNGSLDMLILRVRDLWMQAWKTNKGPQAFDGFIGKLRALRPWWSPRSLGHTVATWVVGEVQKVKVSTR